MKTKFTEALPRHAFRRPRGVFGRLGGLIMARTNRRMAREAVELLDVQPTDRVLEVGFGPGVGIHLLADHSPAQSVAGVDPSGEMVKQARARNAPQIEVGKAELRQDPVENIPFGDAVFDKALAIRSMQLWPEPLAGLAEIERVLRPGGTLVLGFTRHSGETREQLAKLLATAGFSGAQWSAGSRAFYVLATKPDGHCRRAP